MNIRGELNVVKKATEMLALFDYSAQRRILDYLEAYVSENRPWRDKMDAMSQFSATDATLAHRAEEIKAKSFGDELAGKKVEVIP